MSRLGLHPDSGWVALDAQGERLLHFNPQALLQESGGRGSREQGLIEALALESARGLYTLVLDRGNRRIVHFDRGLRAIFREDLPSVFEEWKAEDLEECDEPDFLVGNRGGSLLLVSSDPPCFLLREGAGRRWRHLLRGGLGLAVERIDDCLLAGLDLWLLERRENGALLQAVTLEGAPRAARFLPGLRAICPDPEQDGILLLFEDSQGLRLQRADRQLIRTSLPPSFAGLRCARLARGGLLVVDRKGVAWLLPAPSAGGRP